MKISVIIPVINEEKVIGDLLSGLLSGGQESRPELIVVDGGSTDRTGEIARLAGAKVVISAVARRSIQMNLGAKTATGDVLLFLHADCRPPEGYLRLILKAIGSGRLAGCFRRSMRSQHKKLAWIGFTSRLPGRIFRGGDASLYIDRELFLRIGGFDEEMILMEDYEILKRLRPHTHFHVIPAFIHASDRKHLENNSFRVFIANVLVYSMYLFGFSQHRMLSTYRRMVAGTRYR